MTFSCTVLRTVLPIAFTVLTAPLAVLLTVFTTLCAARPIGLFFWGYGWSLAAWCELRTAFRSFRLDRIRALEVLDERSPEIVDGFLPEPDEQAALEEARQHIHEVHGEGCDVGRSDAGRRLHWHRLSAALALAPIASV